MRPLILLLCIGLAGCASAPYSTVVLEKSTMAHIVVRDRANYAFTPGVDGIIAVNDKKVPNGPVRELWVTPGHRWIDYRCPGWVTVDGPATIEKTFVSSASYELTCESNPTIEQVR